MASVGKLLLTIVYLMTIGQETSRPGTFRPMTVGNHYSSQQNFVCSVVSSNNDLNHLMFIIRNGRLFVVNCNT